jgi:Flp pilus assembly protein TadB
VNLLAGVAAALAAGGVIWLAVELTRRAPQPGTPPRRPGLAARLTGRARRRTVLAVVVGLVVLLLTRWPVAGVAAVAAVIFLPRIVTTKDSRRAIETLEALEQWTRRLSDYLTASRGLEDALEASARGAPPAIAAPAAALARRIAARTSTEDALRAFADDIADPAGDRIAAALIIAASKRGVAMRGILVALADLLSKDVAARREVEAERAQHRTAVRWITVFIAGFSVFAVFNRTYSAPYGTATGEVVLAFIGCLYAAALYWLNKLARAPAPGRFLVNNHGQSADRAAPDAKAGAVR